MPAVALQAAGYVRRFQGVVDSDPRRYLATLLLPLLFVAAVVGIYRLSEPLKRRFTSELVEIARTLVIMGVALADAVLFIVIWGQEKTAVKELDTFVDRLVPTAQTSLSLYIGFIALLGTYTLTRVTKRVIRYWSASGRISPHQRELAHHFVQLSLFAVALVFVFGLFGIDPGDFLIGAGVLGAVVGLAGRRTLRNVLSGLVILFGRPFEAGDWIAVDDQEGIVTDISVFNTQIRTFNEEHLLVPNDRITDTEVINYSKTERLRLTTEVGVDYDDDVSEAAAVAKRTMQDCETVADTPGPDVVLESFGDSSVVLRLRYWIGRPTIQRKLSAQNEVIDAVKGAFDDEEIRIPFPQRELMGRTETDGLEVTTSAAAERAVQPVVDDDGDGEAPTTVSEPVEEEYGGTGAVDDEPDDGAVDADEPDEVVDEGDGAIDADGSTDGDVDGADGADDMSNVPDSAAWLVDEDHDVSSPHPREKGDVYPGTTDESLVEPVEDEHGRHGRGNDDDADGDEEE